MLDDFDIYKPQRIELSDDDSILISTHQIICLAVFPIIKRLALLIISTVTNIFGKLPISKLFVTGSLLAVNEYNSVYDNVIISALKNELDDLIMTKTYKTKLEISVDTCRHDMLMPGVPKEKAFCYDEFLKGHLRMVSSATYLLDKTYSGTESGSQICANINHPDHDNAILVRGQEFTSKRLKVHLKHDDTSINDKFTLGNIAFRKAEALLLNADYRFE